MGLLSKLKTALGLNGGAAQQGTPQKGPAPKPAQPGGDAARWELRRMDNDAFVYGEAASDAPFVHVEDGVQTLLCRYDADGARLRDPLQQGHGYHVKHHTNWFENVHIEVIL